ncbi:MAG: phosphoribosylformylglycinamidine synthase subunit PurS [Steroidobacteraceae bacterium]
MIVKIYVTPRKGILDPQGRAAAGALKSLGFANVNSVHIGRYIVLEVEAASLAAAETAAREMCERLLVNPLIEDYRLEVAGA